MITSEPIAPSGLNMEEAFALHDLLAQGLSVRLLLAGLDVDQTADLLRLSPVIVEMDWELFRRFNEVFPAFARLKRDRDQARLDEALAVLDRELAPGTGSRETRRDVACWRTALQRIAGITPEYRPMKQERPAEAIPAPRPAIRRRKTPIEALAASLGLYEPMIKVRNLAK